MEDHRWDIYPIGRPLIGKWPEPSKEAHSCSDNKRLKRRIALSLTLKWPEWRGSFGQDHQSDETGGEHMHALNANVGMSSAYRVLLQTFLQIPAQAADLAIHHKVKARFPAELLKEFVDAGSFSREACEIIISLRALDARVSRRQLLSVSESDRLFRVARVIALAEVAFGGRDNARRWLNAPKRCFWGNSPVGMLTTTVGAFLIEDTLSQLTEGYALRIYDR